MTTQQDTASLLAQIETLKAANAKLQATQRSQKLTLRVSAKSALSVYNLGGRYPVTLYKSQWNKLLENIDIIRKFLKDHDAELKEKGAEETQATNAV